LFLSHFSAAFSLAQPLKSYLLNSWCGKYSKRTSSLSIHNNCRWRRPNQHESTADGLSESDGWCELANIEKLDGSGRRDNSLLIEIFRLEEKKKNVSNNSKFVYYYFLLRRKHMNTDRWGSDPAGGFGWRNSLIAGVVFDRRNDLLGDLIKFPPKKCRICEAVGAWGVGASRSTAATTKGPPLTGPNTLKCGGPAVAGDASSNIHSKKSIAWSPTIPWELNSSV